MGFLSFQALGENRKAPRLWLESMRLSDLGFPPGTPLHIEKDDARLLIRPGILAENHVSSRKQDGRKRPIIDIASHSLLGDFGNHSELKIIATFGKIEIHPSRRAFAIQKSNQLSPPFRVLEAFAGGGTMTDALNDNFRVVAGIESEPTFADEWQLKHKNALLIQSDIRAVRVEDLPEFDVLIGGIPCTSHSLLGRAKKRLAQRPELGDTGDLFVSVLTMIHERMPAAVLFENVPSFGQSLAGQLFSTHLERLGYNIFKTTLRPNDEWGEIEDRKRWLLIGTLNRPFSLRVPSRICTTPVAAYLDAPNPIFDERDARRIENTLEALRSRRGWHQLEGHGFGFTVLDGQETRIPTLPGSYHKVNSGPFVATPFGPRLLRLSEIERIHGCKLETSSYSAAVQMLGQGVQTRIFREIFSQLGTHLVAR